MKTERVVCALTGSAKVAAPVTSPCIFAVTDAVGAKARVVVERLDGSKGTTWVCRVVVRTIPDLDVAGPGVGRVPARAGPNFVSHDRRPDIL